MVTYMVRGAFVTGSFFQCIQIRLCLYFNVRPSIFQYASRTVIIIILLMFIINYYFISRIIMHYVNESKTTNAWNEIQKNFFRIANQPKWNKIKVIRQLNRLHNRIVSVFRAAYTYLYAVDTCTIFGSGTDYVLELNDVKV